MENSEKSEHLEIIYPKNISKYKGHIIERKKGSFQVVYHRGNQRLSSTFCSYDAAFKFLQQYCIDNNMVKNIIYIDKEKPDEILVDIGNNKKAIFDKADIDLVDKYVLFVNFPKASYSCVSISPTINDRRTKFCHILLGFTYNKDVDLTVDHINRNPLDNRRCNLRLADSKTQANNSSTVINALNIYKSWSRTTPRISVNVREDGKRRIKSYTYNNTTGRTEDYAYSLCYALKHTYNPPNIYLQPIIA